MSIWGLIRFGIGALTSKDGKTDQIESTPATVSSQKGQELAPRCYPWGFDSRSPTGGKRLLVSLSGGTQLAQIGERNDNAKPDSDDTDWSTILHNEVAGTWVKLRSDGGIQMGAKSAMVELRKDGSVWITDKAGGLLRVKDGDITFNGGNVPVNRQGDSVLQSGAMATWMASVTAATGVPPLVGATIGSTGPGYSKVKVP